MGSLRVFSGRDLCQLLSDHGFIEVRRKGSHIVMQKRLLDTTTTVVVPDHDQVRIGTLLSIIRQSALPRNVFEA